MRIFLTSLLLLVLYGCRSVEPPHGHAATPTGPRQKQIFLVIDDAGLDLSEVRRFLDIPVPMTIAVLPHLKQTREVCAVIARYSDKEIILHQPMEAYDRTADTGPGTIYNTTHPNAVAKILDRNLDSVQGAVGINNHMGSRVTENPLLIAEILQYCRDRGLYFLDSKTAYNSVVERVAGREHFHYEGRDVFLDIRHDRQSVRRAWESTVAKARSQGYVIAIGHIWCRETAAAIRDSYETLQNQGYTFHKLSELYE
ncbi:MAG TPA: divergent polysaccharide deacetylase family protein [Pontiella sp.]|nr:divergent polysaccharide deacetylase family protein [Pontiella sp.]